MKYLNDVNYKDCVGKVFKSLNSGDFKILKYNDSGNVEIQFINTGYRKVAEMKEVRNGEVKDPYSPSVYGIGVVGTKYPITVNGVQTKEYDLWKGMLRRCYSDSFKKGCPTYEGCEVSENFEYYEYFYEWCHKQIGFYNEGWQLDKDLLVKGNKVYSENTCVLLPSDINALLVKSDKTRGKFLIGVTFHKKLNKFSAQCNTHLAKHIGYFDTEVEAFEAYKQAKENHLKEVAEKWKDRIDIKAYNALMNYQVEITD